MGPGFGFGGMPTIFGLFFIIILGLIIFNIIKSGARFVNNASSPVLTARARVIGKRIDVRHHSHLQENHIHNDSTTYYYVTFEIENGERMELTLKGKEYGLLMEGDEGILTYQGEWFKNFERGL